MRIRATIREMAASEIAGMIPDEKMKEIRAKDAYPVFKAFVVGHEGESRGNIVGIGNVVKRWFKDLIQKLHGKISAGVQLFHGHAATNDMAGRVPIGEVVGKRLLEIGGKTSSVVACYVYPPFKGLPLDVASIEADINFKPTGGNDVIITDINNITGIALGNSAIETPGFPGATLLGQLQAFIKENNIRMGIESPAMRLGYRLDNTSPPEPLRLAEEKHD